MKQQMHEQKNLKCVVILVFLFYLTHDAYAGVEQIDASRTGVLGGNDKVSVTVKAVQAMGWKVSQWGTPGYLEYVSRTADVITNDPQEFTVTYRCVKVGKNLMLKAMIVSPDNVPETINPSVECKKSDSFRETTLDSGGLEVSMNTKLVNAIGADIVISAPAMLSLTSKTLENKVVSENQKVSVVYKCVGFGQGTVTIKLIKNRVIIDQLDARISCTKPGLFEKSSDTQGVAGDADTVSITAEASFAQGMQVSQWGTPGYLQYVSHSAGTVSSWYEEVKVTYKCVAPGNNLQLKLRLVKFGQIQAEIVKTVSCSGTAGSARFSEVSSDVTGAVGDTDTVSITARAVNAQGMGITQYGQPKYLKYVSRTSNSITSNDQQFTVTYKCIAPGTGLTFKVGITQNGQIRQEITKQVTCSSLPLESAGTLQELSSDVTGTVGDTDTVSITARASNANGMSITQYGQPGYLSYVGRTAASITSNNQDVKVTYKCVAPGTNIQFRMGIVQNGQIARQIAKKVTCLGQANNGRLTWTANDASGTVGSDSDTVSITAAALDAQGSRISQYGQPGYLAYVTRTTGDITTNHQSVTIKYKCVAVGSNIPLTIQLVKNGQLLSQITKPVNCLSKLRASSATLQELSSDLTGTVGDTDTVSITARASNANGMTVTQYGQPGYLSYVGRTAASITSDNQDVKVTYKCVTSGSNIQFRIGIMQNGQIQKEIIKKVSCAVSPSAADFNYAFSDTSGTVGSTDTVSLGASYLDAAGVTISQWGQPGYLQYVDRSIAGSDRSNKKIVTVIYKCVAPGTNLDLKLRLVQNGVVQKEITKKVSCSGSGPKRPAVVAIGGYGSSAASTRSAFCGYFESKGWICVALDSAGFGGKDEDQVVSDINSAVAGLKSRADVDKSKIILGGYSNGALTSLLAASQRSDIFAVAATSPPLPVVMYDNPTFQAIVSGLNTNVVYVFGGGQDVTNEEVAKVIVGAATSRGKQGKYYIIPGAGHNTCTVSTLDLEYNFIKGL